MPQRYAPSIFIGLGGHGGNIVDQIALKLKKRKDWDKLQNIISFIAIDTDQRDLDRRTGVPEDCRFCISNFNKAVYQQQKVGYGEFENDPDSYFTQWAPKTNEYKFRDAQGAGAGQIRLESRVGLHYNLEEGFGLLRKVDEIVNEAIELDDPIKSEKTEIRCYVVGSLAGGTGSGGFLPIGYWLQDRVQYPWSVKLTYILTLPTMFREITKHRHDMYSNGYAALMELEYFNSQLGYDGGLSEIPFHYSPADKKKVVSSIPAFRTYLVDRPEYIALRDVPKVIADAIYLLSFSPMLGAVESEFVHWMKKEKPKAGDGFFSTFYGIFGTHALSFPYNDVIRYATMKKMGVLLRGVFDIHAEDPDDAFLDFVDDQYSNDFQRAGTNLWDFGRSCCSKLYVQFGEWMSLCEKEILESIQVLTPQDVPLSEPLLQPHINHINEMYEKLQNEFVFVQSQASIINHIKSGAFFQEFFTKHAIGPIAQRLIYISLERITVDVDGVEKSFIGPYWNEQDNRALLNNPKVYWEEFKQKGVEWEKDLQNSLEVSIFTKIFGDPEAEFKARRADCIEQFNDIVAKIQSRLRMHFWKDIHSALYTHIKEQLGRFHMEQEQAIHEYSKFLQIAESFMVNPDQDKDSDMAQYTFDLEVMRDDLGKHRLWDCLYRHLFDYSFNREMRQENIEAIEPFDIRRLALVSMRPVFQKKDADFAEVLQSVQETVYNFVYQKMERIAQEKGLNLQTALELEARYIIVREQAQENDMPDPFGTEQSLENLNELIKAVSMTDVESKVEEKISRINRELTVYASLKDGIQSDSSVTAKTQTFFALADQNNDEEGVSLGTIVEKNISGISSVHDTFHDPNRALFYQSIVDIPLYWLSNVRGEMERLYKEKRERNKKGAGYIPHHIDWNWETGTIKLPILDPVAIRAQTRKEERQRAIQMYLQAFYLGILVKKDGEINLLFRGRESQMGENHLECWNAYQEMKPSKKEMIESAINEKWVAETRRSYLLDPVIERLERMQKETEGLFLDADEQERTQLVQHLGLEIESIKDMIRTLKSRQS